MPLLNCVLCKKGNHGRINDRETKSEKQESKNGWLDLEMYEWDGCGSIAVRMWEWAEYRR